MDDDTSPTRRAIPGHGGMVEPANRAAVAKAKFQAPVEAPGERFELRDPFADVTYRANTMQEMAAKADGQGQQRFTAVASDGQRSLVVKRDGQWVREAAQAAAQAVSARQKGTPDRELARGQQPEATNVVPMQGAAKDRLPTQALAAAQEEPQTKPVDAQALVRIDAQAERAALVARLETALRDRYTVRRAPVTVGDVTIGRTEYRFKGDTSRVAFTESTFKLATDTNSPSVARSMVDLAETRNWKAIRVSGHEEFRRMVWFEASLRGVKALGYEPLPSDMAWLRSERESRLVNRIEPAREAAGSAGARAGTNAAPANEKGSVRGGGSRKAVLAAIEAVLVAKGVPEHKRYLVMAAATEKLAQRIRDGQPLPKVKVYDKAAPSQRPAAVPTPEIQRARDRAAPAPSR